MKIRDITESGTTFNVANMNVFVLGNDDDKKTVINPGIDYGANGLAKMTPPLQQQLGVMKDAVGVTTDDVTKEPSEEEKEQIVATNDQTLDRLKKLAAVFTPGQQFPSG